MSTLMLPGTLWGEIDSPLHNSDQCVEASIAQWCVYWMLSVQA